jgi:hypothetical protein
MSPDWFGAMLISSINEENGRRVFFERVMVTKQLIVGFLLLSDGASLKGYGVV